MSQRAASSESAGGDPGAQARRASRKDLVVERLSRYGIQVMAGASQRRWRLQGPAGGGSARRVAAGLQEDAPERRQQLLEPLGSGSSGAASSQTAARPPGQDADWDLYRREHAWMLSAVEGNYETILDFLSQDARLLTRRDFISGYSVLHWLAKGGQHETLIRLLRHAEDAGIPVNVNVRGSGGLTPLHVASMHGRYLVVKLLVGAFGADVDAMDYSGRRAWRYLQGDAPPEIRELLGTWDDEHTSGGAQSRNRNGNNNCADAPRSTDSEPEERAEPQEPRRSERPSRAAGWGFGSLRKLLPPFAFPASKS